jgi:hypothetical protein
MGSSLVRRSVTRRRQTIEVDAGRCLRGVVLRGHLSSTWTARVGAVVAAMPIVRRRLFDGCRRVACSMSASRRSAATTSRRSPSPKVPDMATDRASCSRCSGVGSSVTRSIMTQACRGRRCSFLLCRRAVISGRPQTHGRSKWHRQRFLLVVERCGARVGQRSVPRLRSPLVEAACSSLTRRRVRRRQS